MISGYYTCGKCAHRFPITDVLSGLASAEGVLAATSEHATLTCPACGGEAKRCEGCRQTARAQRVAPATAKTAPAVIPANITTKQRESWRLTLPLHCPDCRPGETCPTCGHDYSRLIYR